MASDASGPRTLIVKGLGPDVTEDQVESFFSAQGPISRAFLVRKGKDGPHKGFGFVQFALASDAQTAAAKLDGKRLEGSKIKVEVANKRASLEERKQKRLAKTGVTPSPPATGDGDVTRASAASAEASAIEQATGRPVRAQRDKAQAPQADKHRLVRSVAVAGPGAGDESELRSILSAAGLGDAVESLSPLPLDQRTRYMLTRDGMPSDQPATLVAFKTTKAALQAAGVLHKGAQPRSPFWARQVSGDGLHLKRWRVVVRNLPFVATEAAIRAAFTAAVGAVWEVTVPISASGRGRGFAFVGLLCPADAQRAIAAVNGTRIAGRTVAVDWALSKAQYQRQTELGGPAVTTGKEREAGGSDADSDADPGNASDSDDEHLERRGSADRETAVQAGSGNERAIQASVLDALLGGGKRGREAEEESASGSEEGEEESGDDDEEEETNSEDSGYREDDEVAAPPVSTSQPPPSSNGDIFGKAALAAAAAAASGHQRVPLAARPLLDRASKKAPQTSKSSAAGPGDEEGRGPRSPAAPDHPATDDPLVRTVFVRGLPLDVTKDQLWQKMKAFGRLRACRLVMNKDSGKPKGTAFVEYVDTSGANVAAAAAAAARDARGPAIAVGGRAVEVDLALDRDGARDASAKQQGGRAPKEGRNLHLSKEGVIVEGSDAWEQLSASDQAKRRRAAVERKTKLASPNFVVNANRLSVRNIPFDWDEARLKRIFVAAVKERATKAVPKVRQAKILRDTTRADGDGGTSTSKGIGFVEFEDAEHALCALRQLNNNPSTFRPDRRPIIEFAMDNVKVLKAREDREAKRQVPEADRRKEKKGAGGGDAAPAGPPAAREAAPDRAVPSERKGAGEPLERGTKRPPLEPGQLSKSQKRRLLRQKKASGAQPDGDEGASVDPLDKAVDLRALRAPTKPAAPEPPIATGAKRPGDGITVAGKGHTKRKATPQMRNRSEEAPVPRATGALKPKAKPMKHSPEPRSTRSRGKGSDRQEFKLDDLISQYRNKLSGDGKAKSGGKKLQLNRWFD